MNKEFISYEQALELKALGFDGQCFGYYVGNELITSINDIFNTTEILIISAPLYQQAFRWFREKYDIYPIIEAKNYFKSPIKWIYSTCNVNGSFEVGLTNHNTYEEAELACLKKLIEIVKNK